MATEVGELESIKDLRVHL